LDSSSVSIPAWKGMAYVAFKTLYRVIPSESPPGSLTITIATSPEYALSQPWNLGFDFDMDRDRIEPGKKYGTCVIFSQEEPPDETESGKGEGTLGAVFRGDGNLEVNAFVDLGDEKAMLYSYNNVSLWRLDAVGNRK